MGFAIALVVSAVLWVGIYYGAKAAYDWSQQVNPPKQEQRLTGRDDK